MPTISGINQQLSSYAANLSTLKDAIESMASAKNVSISYNVDTPITLLSKISANIIPIPTSTISFSSNGIYSCGGYKYASVYISSPSNIGVQIIERTISSLIDTQSSINFINQYLLADCSLLSIVSLPECSFIGSFAFESCSALTSLSLPSCKSIYLNAFRFCSGLTNISLPECTFLGESAFSNCYNVINVSIPKCTEILDFCFSGCTNLTSVYLPVCGTIWNNAFSGCQKLPSISLPKCRILYNAAFSGCSRLSSVYIGLEYSSVCTLRSVNVFNSTPMSNSTYLGYFGSIYVPSSLYASYSTATNWAAYANRITSYVES